MKKILILLIAILFYGCSKHPKISISNTLEIALESHNQFSDYVRNLNKAVDGNRIALLSFFKINYINDAAGYDHGYILFQLMKIYGDKKFSDILQQTNEEDLRNVRQYFEVGIDANSDKENNQMKINYPISSKILQIK